MFRLQPFPHTSTPNYYGQSWSPETERERENGGGGGKRDTTAVPSWVGTDHSDCMRIGSSGFQPESATQNTDQISLTGWNPWRADGTICCTVQFIEVDSRLLSQWLFFVTCDPQKKYKSRQYHHRHTHKKTLIHSPSSSFKRLQSSDFWVLCFFFSMVHAGYVCVSII